MTQPLLQLLLIISFSFVGLIHSIPLRKESEADQQQQQVAECNEKLDAMNAFSDCSSLVALNWNCIHSGTLPDEGNSAGQHHHHQPHRLVLSCGDDQQGPLFCCPVWALLRCMLQQVKLHCASGGGDQQSSSSEEGDNFSQQYQAVAFQSQIDELQQSSRCAQFPFSSSQCDSVLAFIRDQFALESDAIQSGMYQYFFPNVNASRLAYLRSYKSSATSSRATTLNFVVLVSCLILLASLSCAFSSTSSYFTDCLFG